MDSTLSISGGGDTARENVERLLETRTINGLSVELDLDFETRWDEPYETLFGIPDGSPKYAVFHAGIDVDEWLAIQHRLHGGGEWSAYRESATQSTVDRVAADIAAGEVDDIPTPVLEIKPDYTVGHSEGRSRGFGAKEAGLDVMPIWVAVQEYR